MDPEHVCEVYILYLIGRLDGTTEKRFMSTLQAMNAPYASIDEFMQEYEREESIYVDLIEWVKAEWANALKENPETNAKQFAKDKVPDFLSSLS
ncbi:MAG: hypothetical protein R3C20_11435 [Planctomycetaceae bacterium]